MVIVEKNIPIRILNCNQGTRARNAGDVELERVTAAALHEPQVGKNGKSEKERWDEARREQERGEEKRR
jgi:hypothetical protein